MDSEPPASLSSLIAICIRKVHGLLTSLPTESEDARVKLQDDLGRLRVWVGNFGAHRKQTDRLSLDYRLREAPDLHRMVREHIRDISEGIHKAIDFVSESEGHPQIEKLDLDPNPEREIFESDSDSDDSDSDGFWDQVKAEDVEYSRMDEYLNDIQHTITSLYKFSLALQNPAHRDRTAKASRIDLGHFEFYDIQHVANKFNLPDDSILVQRLGKANTRRRQLLAYHKDHTEKVSRYIDVAVNIAPDKPIEKIKDIPGPKSISTKWTQDTTVSTIHALENDAASDSGQTKFSAATSTTGDQPLISIPPPPQEDSRHAVEGEMRGGFRSTPFFCTYCHHTIQLDNKDEDWNHHVLGDLRPYICTFGDCIKPDQLYDSYTEWSEHERQFHRREWSCSLCPSIFHSKDAFSTHLEAHTEEIPPVQHQVLINLSERSLSSAQQCPLCSKPPIQDPKRFQEHLARHLQQLSLFVLPRPESESEHDRNSSNMGSNESRQALGVGSEDGKSSQFSSTTRLRFIFRANRSPIPSEGSGGDLQSDYSVNSVTQREKIDALEQTLGPNHPSTLEAVRELGALYWSQGLSDKAEKAYTQAIAGYEKNPGSGDISTVSLVRELGDLYREQGLYDKAEKMHTQAIAGHERTVGPDDRSTLALVCELGVLYRGQGRYDEAQRMFTRAIAAFERTLGPAHEATLEAIWDLGKVYHKQNELHQAEIMYTQALAGCEQALGPRNHLRLLVVADLGDLYFHQDRFDEAEEMYTRVLADYEQTIHPLNLYTLRILVQLGNVYFHKDRFDDAEMVYKLALADYDQTLGPASESSLEVLGILGSLYLHQYLFDEAENVYTRLLVGFEQTLGTEHTSALEMVRDIGRIQHQQRKWDLAEQMFIRARDGFLRTAGPGDEKTTSVVILLGELYLDQHKWDKAETTLKHALASVEAVPGQQDERNGLSVLQLLGKLSLFKGELGTAESTFKRVVVGCENSLGPDHYRTLSAVEYLGDVYRGLNELDQAEQAYARAVSGYERLLGTDNSWTLRAADKLKALYSSTS